MAPLLLPILLVVAAVSASIPSAGIPLDDPIYPFIDKMAAVHGLRMNNLHTRPFTRRDAARFLLEVREGVAEGRIKLTRASSGELAYYLDEFSGDLRDLEPAAFRERHLFAYRDSSLNDRLLVDLGFKDSAGYVSSSGMAYTNATFYGGVRGLLKGKLAFQSRITVSSEINTDSVYRMQTYEPVDGYPYNTFGDSGWVNKKSWDTFESGLFFETSFFRGELGVDRMRLGPSERNALTLSGNTPPMGLLKLETGFWKVHYLHSVAFIKGRRYADKYLYAHRLEFRLPGRTTLGLNEALVYGDNAGDGDTTLPSSQGFGKRSLDPVYAVPFIPYYFAQHYNGDRENTALSLDVSTMRVAGLKLYGELFLDDLISPLSFFDDGWSNKWAATLGGRWYLPVAWPDLSLLLEYTRIEPWVYTHFLGESHRYRHYGASLGSTVGPNGDEFFLGLDCLPSRRFDFTLTLRNTRQDTGKAGDRITDIHTAGLDGNRKAFLGGSVEARTLLGLEARAEFTRLIRGRLFARQSLRSPYHSELSGAIDFYW